MVMNPSFYSLNLGYTLNSTTVFANGGSIVSATNHKEQYSEKAFVDVMITPSYNLSAHYVSVVKGKNPLFIQLNQEKKMLASKEFVSTLQVEKDKMNAVGSSENDLLSYSLTPSKYMFDEVVTCFSKQPVSYLFSSLSLDHSL